VSEYKQAQALKLRRRHAWNLLKQTRNPTYVSLQFPEFPLEKLEAALEKIPDDSGRPFVRSDPAEHIRSGLVRAGDLLPESLGGPAQEGTNSPGSARRHDREPGSDDECKHGKDPRRCDCCINGRRAL
jgi:hypothetical protein